MYLLLLVAIGGALGSCFRYILSQLAIFHIGEFFINNICINILGSFILGFVYSILREKHLTLWEDKSVEALICYGFCGGFTTFSSFSWQSFKLLQQDHMFLVMFNILISVGASLLALACSYWLGQKINL